MQFNGGLPHEFAKVLWNGCDLSLSSALFSILCFRLLAAPSTTLQSLLCDENPRLRQPSVWAKVLSTSAQATSALVSLSIDMPLRMLNASDFKKKKNFDFMIFSISSGNRRRPDPRDGGNFVENVRGHKSDTSSGVHYYNADPVPHLVRG